MLESKIFEKTIYRINTIRRAQSKKGYPILRVGLNGDIAATSLISETTKKFPSSTLIESCDGDLERLIGRYIIARLTKTQFGYQFFSIDQADFVGAFVKVLDKGQANFNFDFLLYNFLSSRGNRKEDNGDICLKYAFKNYRVTASSVVYNNSLSVEDFLNLILDPIERRQVVVPESRSFRYRLLRKRGFHRDKDRDIRLPTPFNHYCMTEEDVCYIKPINDDQILTPENLDIIYEKYFSGGIKSTPSLIATTYEELDVSFISNNLCNFKKTKYGVAAHIWSPRDRTLDVQYLTPFFTLGSKLSLLESENYFESIYKSNSRINNKGLSERYSGL
jgi:hypothetical protein